MRETSLRLRDGRRVGYVAYGAAEGLPVLWCHGGPGSRLEPAGLADAAQHAGLQLVGIDRPGYGLSSLRPHRSIADWVPDALAVADAIGAARFLVVGVSTGGAYALALAALAPERVLGGVACCALTDMRFAPARALADPRGCHAIWDAPNRDAALRVANEHFGEDGSRFFDAAAGMNLPPADLALLADPTFASGQAEAFFAQFANGVQAYVDDRRADGVGWQSFDVRAVAAPFIVLHGGSDSIVPRVNAHHTAELVRGSALRILEGHGHLSIIGEVLGPLTELAGATR